MASLTLAELERLRAKRYRRLPELQLEDEEEALEFIEERGFVLLFNCKGLELPDLWQATRGFEVAWPWKQILPGAKLCAYGKLLHRKGLFVSWEYFPRFIAIYSSTNSYMEEYRAGRISQLEREILETLEGRGPLLTRELRHLVASPGRSGTRAFHQALDSLQASLRITVAGGVTTGWSMHRWELMEDWVPREVLKRGWRMPPEEAKRDLLLKYLEAAVVSTPRDIAYLFGWEMAEAEHLVQGLERQALVEAGVEVRGLKGSFIAQR